MRLIAVRLSKVYFYQKPGQIGQSYENLDTLGYPAEIEIILTEKTYEIPKFKKGALDRLPEAGSILHLGHLKIPYRIVED